jgi:hypothetical protein
MTFLARALEGDKPPVETVRLANAAARLMESFRDGFLALHRMRSGGQQVVTVQHVTVQGGQAIVAGNIDRGTRTVGGGQNDVR